MSVILKCPACRQKMQVALYFQGSTVTCGSCERELDVPRCVYESRSSTEDNAAMDEADFLANLPEDRERRYDARITRNISRRGGVTAVRPFAVRRAALLILLVIVGLIGMLCLWSALQDPSVAGLAAGR